MPAKRARKARTTNVVSNDVRPMLLKIMDSLGGDSFAYYNIDPKSIKIGTERAKIKFYMKVLVSQSSRTEATNKVKKALEARNVPNNPDAGENTIEVDVVTGDPTKGIIRLDIKPTKGGSGAGSSETAKNEAGQALFAALRWSTTSDLVDGGWSQDQLEAVMVNCDLKAPGKNLSVDTLLQVDSTWFSSHVKGANLLYEKFGSNGKTYSFHRGSDLVKEIEDVWKICNKASDSYFSDVNKWSPADIYLVSNQFLSTCLPKLKTSTTLETLNAHMQQCFDSEDLIGVSLKKIESGNGRYSVKNKQGAPKPVDKVTYRGIVDTTFDSIDTYVKWGEGSKDKIQFRNTGGSTKLSWQGEIKGVSAAQGKVGGGVVDGIIKRLGYGNLSIKTGHETIKQKTNPKYAKAKDITNEIYNIAKDNASDLTGFSAATKAKNQTITDIAHKDHSWRYSKYINLKLIEIIKGLNQNQQTEFVRALYFYAASQSELSAVYAKVE